MENNYQIILAKPEYLAALSQIERAAAEIFPEGMIPDELKDNVLSLEDFENALAKNQLWTAVTLDNKPVGFAMALVKGESAMLAEIDVDPEHQRKGLGRNLVQTIINWAREEGMKAFLENEDAKWRCSECGEAICCHNGLCLNCDLDKLRRNRKYRWGER